VSTEEPQQPDPGQPPTEEELRAAFEEQMRRITVPDVIIQTAVTLINLGAQKLGEDGDMLQAKMAIDGARALLPLLPEGPTPEEDIRGQIQNALSQLQMAFVQASQGAAEAQEAGQAPPEPDDDAEREQARSKIWTPPGS
jgi:hypothetical protein